MRNAPDKRPRRMGGLIRVPQGGEAALAVRQSARDGSGRGTKGGFCAPQGGVREAERKTLFFPLGRRRVGGAQRKKEGDAHEATRRYSAPTEEALTEGFCGRPLGDAEQAAPHQVGGREDLCVECEVGLVCRVECEVGLTCALSVR